jgi:hypothetical protein
MMVLNMIERGVLGDIVHCEGGYRHDLREEIAFGEANRHYRLEEYKRRNCENYPTHELGPLARVLNINRGNRMVKLCSVASRASGLNAYVTRADIAAKKDAPTPQRFAQGDVVTTIITCAGGETMTLTLDTTLPRPYSRGFHVQGTKGLYNEDNHMIFLDGEHNEYEFRGRELWGNADGYLEKYEHPVWKAYLAEGVKGGHDGMDWLELSAFFNAVEGGLHAPIDVYDMASWMSVSCLSEASIASGGAPVAFPDFTNGRWIRNRN